MALVLTEEQLMLRDSARGFIADNAPLSQLRKLRDARDELGFSRSVWQRFAYMGFTSVLIPEQFGGPGLGYVEAGVVMEEIGRQLTASPFLASSVVAATVLLRAGSASQKESLLPSIADGERIATLAIDERSKHSPLALQLTATEADGGWTLNGDKKFVLYGHVADTLIVAARSAGAPGDATAISLFLVDRNTQGVSIEPALNVDSQYTANVAFRDVRVAATALLGAAGEGWPLLQRALDAGRAAAAAEMLGIAEEVFARTIAYLKERKQFDRVIGEFQALQHRMAMLYCDIELSRSVVLKALQSLDADDERASSIAAIAKAHVGKTVTRAVQEGVQLHGGMGMTDEFDMGFFMKRARVLQELFGDAGFHMNQLALQRQY